MDNEKLSFLEESRKKVIQNFQQNVQNENVLSMDEVKVLLSSKGVTNLSDLITQERHQ